MEIYGKKFNIYLCRNVGEYREIYKPNPDFLMLEEIDVSHTDINESVRICYNTKNINKDLFLKIYDKFIYPNFKGIRLKNLSNIIYPISPQSFNAYDIIYDIPEEDLFYIKLKGQIL